jgi:hypothetical protein
MKTPLTPRVLAVVAYVFMVAMNAAATTLPLNNQTTNEISDRYDTLFAPIGFTFAIWGVIYLLLGVYSVYQLVRDHPWIPRITPWFIASSLLNGLWIIAWHYEVLWGALVIIIGLLITLARINTVTTRGRAGVATTLALRLPFSVYFGWVSVATVANASALLVQWGWRGGELLNEQAWTVLIVIVATVIGVLVTLVNSSAAFGLVFVWALWGIYSRHISAEGWDRQYGDVILTLQIALPLLGVATLFALIRWLRKPLDSPQSTRRSSRGN